MQFTRKNFMFFDFKGKKNFASRNGEGQGWNGWVNWLSLCSPFLYGNDVLPRKTNFLGRYLAKQVLYFEKMISNRNLQRITTPSESVNQQKLQAQVVITVITFYFIFSYQLTQTFTFFLTEERTTLSMLKAITQIGPSN